MDEQLNTPLPPTESMTLDGNYMQDYNSLDCYTNSPIPQPPYSDTIIPSETHNIITPILPPNTHSQQQDGQQTFYLPPPAQQSKPSKSNLSTSADKQRYNKDTNGDKNGNENENENENENGNEDEDKIYNESDEDDEKNNNNDNDNYDNDTFKSGQSSESEYVLNTRRQLSFEPNNDNNHVEDSRNQLSKQKPLLEMIIYHTYKNRKPLFRVKWTGFKLYDTYNLQKMLNHKEILKKYISCLSKRAKTTLLKREKILWDYI